ncbi:uncharacterized protein ly97.2 [Mustelus asterias]
MKSLFLLGCAVVLCVSLGACLECYHCSLSLSRCTTGAKNCTNANEVCYERIGKAGSATATSSGCISPSSCNKTIEESFLNFKVSLTTKCCKQDRCNGSSHVQSSLLLIFALASLCLAGFR